MKRYLILLFLMSALILAGCKPSPTSVRTRKTYVYEPYLPRAVQSVAAVEPYPIDSTITLVFNETIQHV